MPQPTGDLSVALIWAMAENRVIGRDNRLPWRLPTDMQFFMHSTVAKPVIMGRNTFESMKAPLPGRTNIVVTRSADYALRVAPGVQVASSFESALELAQAVCERDQRTEMMVAGGSAIYAAGLAVATRLYVTTVHADIEGDTYFPVVDWEQWRNVWSRRYEIDARHKHPFTIAQWDRI